MEDLAGIKIVLYQIVKVRIVVAMIFDNLSILTPNLVSVPW